MEDLACSFAVGTATRSEQISSFLAGELPAAMESAFEEHLFVCASCLAEFELQAALRELLAPSAPGRRSNPGWRHR
jgi:anti-sigma factor RsiW